MPRTSDIIRSAQLIAIERLVRIVRDSPSEREARLAAVALLKIDPDEPALATGSQPVLVPTGDAPTPLGTDELNALRRLLPHLRPERFTRKPANYWRAILAKHASPLATPSPLRQAG